MKIKYFEVKILNDKITRLEQQLEAEKERNQANNENESFQAAHWYALEKLIAGYNLKTEEHFELLEFIKLYANQMYTVGNISHLPNPSNLKVELIEGVENSWASFIIE